MLLEEGVCNDQCILLAKLLVFPLLHVVLQGQTCLLLHVSLDFSISVPYDEKDIYFILFLFYFLVSVLESLLGHLKAIELHLLWH